MARGFHNDLPVVARIKPQAITAAATASSNVIDMSYWDEVIAYINLGDYAAGNDGTVVAKITIDTADGMGSEVDMTGKAITGASFSGSGGDDAMAIIRIAGDEMTQSGTAYRYARLNITPSNQNLTAGAVLVGVRGRYGPGTDQNISDVTEIIE